MTEALDGEYTTALRAFLAGGGQAALGRARDVGRKALGGGLGVLDMAALHQRTIETVVSTAPPSQRPQFARAAGDVLRELLSAFDTMFRGERAVRDELSGLHGSVARQRETMERVNREFDSFCRSVSHDLRAPLHGINGLSQALLEDYDDKLDARGKEFLRFMGESAKQMERLIDGLLALGRVTRSELDPASVDMSTLARTISDRLVAAEPGREAEFLVEESVTARGDPRLLQVVLENLLGNAWKFTPKDRPARIEFGCREDVDSTTYFVRDNGAGFDMRHAGKLFGAFQRLHPPKDFPGMGMGLAKVQRIVHLHGGRVWPEAEVDRGATFYFTLPAAP